MHFVHSQIVKHAIKMDYKSTLETLENFWMILSWRSELQIGARAILYPLVKVSIAHGCHQGALFNLSQLLSMPYTWITRIL